MEIFVFLLALSLMVFGPMAAFAAYAFSADRSTQGNGVVWIALSMLLIVLLGGALVAIGLFGTFFTFVVMVFGHDSPSTTEWQRLEGLAIPMMKMIAALAGSAGAAWLWPRPIGRYASFPIALVLVALACETWSHLGH